jgi:hypothetical protein
MVTFIFAVIGLIAVISGGLYFFVRLMDWGWARAERVGADPVLTPDQMRSEVLAVSLPDVPRIDQEFYEECLDTTIRCLQEAGILPTNPVWQPEHVRSLAIVLYQQHQERRQVT